MILDPLGSLKQKATPPRQKDRMTPPKKRDTGTVPSQEAEDFSASDPEYEENKSSSTTDDLVAFDMLISRIVNEYKLTQEQPKQRKGLLYDLVEQKTEPSTTALPTDADIMKSTMDLLSTPYSHRPATTPRKEIQGSSSRPRFPEGTSIS